MRGYDWGWGRRYDRGFRGRHPRYGADYRSWGADWGMIPGGGWGQGAAFEEDLWSREGFQVGYDRDVYGASYPGPRRYSQPRHFEGGARGGYDRFDRPRPGGDYDRGYAREPFVPEQAYQRHPELGRSPRHRGDHWPSGGNGNFGAELGDDEIRRSVRQNLFSDDFIDAERIEVSVADQVVTLTGEVDDYLEARYAWDDAWDAPGVRGVVNQLTVRTDQPREPHGEVVQQTSGGKKK